VFEIKILLLNVILPSAIMLTAIVIARFLHHPEPPPTDGNVDGSAVLSQQIGTRTASAVVVLATVLAIWSAFALRNEFAVWHEDAWMRLPFGMTIVAVASLVTIWITATWAVAVVRLLGVLAAAFLIFPQGETWDFLLPTRTYWIGAVAGSCWAAWMLIDRRSSREAAIQGLGWIVLFAAAAFLTAQSFLKVTEPLLAVSAVIGCLSLASLLANSPRTVVFAAGPSLFTLSGAVASAQFNSFLGLPDMLSWLAMSTPAISACVSWPFLKNPAPGRTLKKSYVVACVISCCLLAGVIVAFTAQLAGGGGEDW
jgi:hypothetical protein